MAADPITIAKGICDCLKPIWSFAYPHLEPHLKPIYICICKLEKEIEALRNKHPGIEQKISNAEKFYLQAVLKFLENKTENEENLKYVTNNLLPMLQGVGYDVADVLDKWNTVKLMLEIEKSSQKVCCLIPSFSFYHLSLLGEIAFDMEALKEKLQTFEVEKIELNEDLNGQLIKCIRSPTCSFGLPKVKGRDEERELCISKLKMSGRRSNQGGSCDHKTICILGTGGAGKTTLVKFILSNQTFKEDFKTVWVFAPYKFDLDAILRTILELVNRRGLRHANGRETLLQLVAESIKDKTLILVLDDIRDVSRCDSQEEWKILEQVFENSDPSSRILVTTQDHDVVEMIEACNDCVIRLQLLSESDCQRERADDDKIRPFFLNYYGLHPRQKRCFSYCSVFPRNYQIEIDDLLELWMSQDYFSAESSAEKEGLECFKILAKRCLFREDYNGEVIKCTMPGLLYEFAQFLSEPEKARHVLLSGENFLEQIPNSMNEKKKLRTLFVVPSETSSSTQSNSLSCDFLVELKCLRTLRTLNLGYCNILELPEKLDKLVHLRYLNLSGNPLRTLPNALCCLFNLQTLRLKECTQLQRLPEGMGNLASKFCNLHIEGCNNLKALPREIERLTNLRRLDMFIIPSPDNPQDYEALKLEDLKQLKDIQGSIPICHCRKQENAYHLIQIGNLVLNDRENYHLNLKQNFDGSSNNTGIGGEGAILDALQPHSNLISLEIRGCISTSFPKWVDSLTILKRLVLSSCPNWVSLPPVGTLQSLESLQIDSMDRVEKVDLQLLGVASNEMVAFPKLKEIHFSCLTSWKTWEYWTTSSEEEEHDLKIMPDLASLQISGCDNLKELPGFLRGTRKLLNLTIDKCGTLNPRCQKGVGADWYKISHIQNIKIDGVTIKSPSLAEFQASTSGSSAVPSPGLTSGASTSMDSSNIRCSVAATQASTSGSCAGSSAASNPGSTAGPSTVVNPSNKC